MTDLSSDKETLTGELGAVLAYLDKLKPQCEVKGDIDAAGVPVFRQWQQPGDAGREQVRGRQGREKGREEVSEGRFRSHTGGRVAHGSPHHSFATPAPLWVGGGGVAPVATLIKVRCARAPDTGDGLPQALRSF